MGERHAVIVGIDSYADAPLTSCVRDASDFQACLDLDNYGFDSQILLNQQATRSNILQAMAAKVYPDSHGDVLIFFFAGHGWFIGGSGHLVTVDVEGYDPGISLSHLAQLMETASDSYNHVVSILDCCHSGAAFTWANSRPLQPRDIERDLPTVNQSRCILAACRPDETAGEVKGANGYFTNALLDGMLGRAVDGRGDVTVMALHEYVARAIPPHIQTPMFRGDVAGTVVLGSGFDPPQGPPIPVHELAQTLAKAQTLADEYYILQSRELADRSHRLTEGAADCARDLEMKLRWFTETEVALPDLRRNAGWLDLTNRMRDYQKALADLEEGMKTVLGTVERKVGEGGYGQVWELKQDDRRLALKTFHSGQLHDQVKVQRFRNGYQAMKDLNHPRIVKVHDLTLAPFGFSMDLIQGSNLRESYIDRSDPEVVLRLLLDIADTVRHAHSRGVRHRDIKPENIIVVLDEAARPVPYLTDFDLAYHETNRTITTNLGVGGVINYAAPEQLYKPNTATARAATVDVYSLAQLIFFVLVGRDPSAEHFDKNVSDLKKALGSWVDDRAATPLLDLYAQATSRDPADRPQDLDGVIEALARSEAAILEASGTGALGEDDLCRRLGHLYAGLGNYTSSADRVEMASLSGQLEIIARLKDVYRKKGEQVAIVEMEMIAQNVLPVPGFKTGSDARKILNARIDRALGRWQNVVRTAGNEGMYQVFVTARDVPLSVEGMTGLYDVLVATVGAIERW